ncbi:hypothetical protein HAX54_017108 [Datura stramonium]|uniref:Uncharacterized protein n=1 Tax=Datura stramonium TaxID=4076 RepID=A0ABS8UM33_DATST|nr:hypothetical protein [Datura stramonium]
MYFQHNLHEPGSPASQPPVSLSPEQNPLPKDATDIFPSASSPSASPPCVASSPKWDGTPQKLRILSNLADEQESEENLDDEPLAWKVRKVSSCEPETQSRDQPDVVVDEDGIDENLMAASFQGKAPLSSPKPKGKRKVALSHKEKTKRRKPTPVVSEDEMRAPADASSSSSPERASRTKRAGASSKVRTDDLTRLSREDRQLILQSQKVLRGRVFDPDICDMVGMAELVEMVNFQGWRHLFVPPVPTLHEAEFHPQGTQ